MAVQFNVCCCQEQSTALAWNYSGKSPLYITNLLLNYRTTKAITTKLYTISSMSKPHIVAKFQTNLRIGRANYAEDSKIKKITPQFTTAMTHIAFLLDSKKYNMKNIQDEKNKILSTIATY
jgi:hypothetical protein